jgi:hypothetical protein
MRSFFIFIMMKTRLQAAAKAASFHLICSAIVALCAAGLVFGIWYPPPYDALTGGRGLFVLILIVDLVCGPLLTLILFNPNKSKGKWRLDLALIVFIQLAALLYGLSQTALARPVFLAFESNRFRIVQALDVDQSQLPQAKPPFQTLGYWGPKIIAARLSQNTDADYLASLKLSLDGQPPAFRPSRWVDIQDQAELIRQTLEPIEKLKAKHPKRKNEIDQALQKAGLSPEDAGYLPLVREPITDWVAFVDRKKALPVGFLQIDGW